jgi:glycosyl transferase, family 25
MPVPIFVINLDRSTDRLASITQTFAQASMTFTRWPAVDGRVLPEPLRGYFADHRLTPGELGCYASHVAIWEHMVRAGVPVALVCEDDIRVPPQFASHLVDTISAAPTGWEVIKLSSPANRATHAVAQINAGHALVRYWRVPMWTGAYLIALSGARKLLAFRCLTISTCSA